MFTSFSYYCLYKLFLFLYFFGTISISINAQLGGRGSRRSSRRSDDEGSIDLKEHAQNRIYETIDNFMNMAVDGLNMWNEFYELGGFPNGMNALDQDLTIKYLYSLYLAKGTFAPFYGLEDGTMFGYFYASKHHLVPDLIYREPGEDGYDLYDDIGRSIYLDTCVDRVAGEPKLCWLSAGENFTSCENNGCELVDCNSIQQEQEQQNESNMVWCKNHTIQTASDSGMIGYIPLSTYCINSNGAMSQTPGEVQVETVLSDGSVGVELGDCTYENGAIVQRSVWGPFASCGGDWCDTTYIGAKSSDSQYDPRLRPWYNASRLAQKPVWTDPYIFTAPQDDIGITFTHPIMDTNEEGQTIFVGVMSADVPLGGISSFLVDAFNGTENSVAIYEVAEPHHMIGVSTGSEIIKKVFASNHSQTCTEEQSKGSECIVVQISIHELNGTTEDRVLRRAHEELKEENYETFDDGLPLTVKESDDINATFHIIDFIVYDQPDANLEWGIIVTRPVQRDLDDAIVKGDGSFIVICCLASIGFAVCSGLVLLFFKHRNERAIKLADYKFTSVFVAACALMNLCSFTFLGEATDSICMLRMWAYYLLGSMALSPLLVKTMRTYRLLGAPASTGRTEMNNCGTWLRTLPIVLAQCAILLTFTILNPPKAKDEIFFVGLTPTQQKFCAFEDDDSGLTREVFLFIQLAFFGTLIAVGCILAFLTRNIDPRFADAKALSFAMYNIAFTGVMFAVISQVVNITYTGVSVMTAIGVFWVTTFSSFVFVLPRVMSVRKEQARTRQSLVRLKGVHGQRMNRQFSSLDDVDMIHDYDNGGALRVLVCSANMGNAEPTLSSMKSWIPESGLTDDITTLNGDPIDAETFDLIAIGMQESTWSAAKSMQKENSEENLDIFESERAPDDNEQAILAALEGADTVTLRKLQKDILGNGYRLLKEEIRGQMRLYIWALEDLFPYLEQVKVSGANTGIGNVLANKGGIVVSFEYKDTTFSFLSAHLAAHEGESYYKSRCDNVYDILRSAKPSKLSQRFDLSLSSNHMFVFGDLNFRTKFNFTRPSLANQAIRTKESLHEDNVNRALDLIEKERFDELYSFDELHQGVANGDLLAGFETLPCPFPPTFKVERQEGFVYKKQRTPSYTDRILFKSSPGVERLVRPLSYEACVDFVTSDHKPIRGAFSVAPNAMIDPFILDCQFRMVFSEMECSNLPAADVNGFSDPFLKFVWSSIEMAEAKKKGVSMGWFGKKKWPQTSHKPRNLNPKWEGEKIILVSKGHEISPDAVLYIAAYDYDFGSSDDVLGTLALSIRDLINMKRGKSSKKLVFDRPLQKYGKVVGQIKFKLKVSMIIG